MDATITKNIVSTLQPEFEKFRDDCMKVYSDQKETFDAHVKKTHDTLVSKFDSTVKCGMAKIMDGKDLYDYTTISKKTIGCCMSQGCHPILTFNTHCTNYYTIEECLGKLETQLNSESKKEFNETKNKFLNMIKNEKVVILSVIPSNPMSTSGSHQIYDSVIICITNFGRIIKLITSQGQGNYLRCQSEYYNFDVWLPTDYINLLEMQLQMIYIKPDRMVIDTKPGTLVNIIKYIKETLYNRKFVPLYVEPIIKENEELKSAYEKYDKDSSEFYEFKQKFETECKPYMDLVNDRIELDKIREDLKKEKDKLRLVAVKLEMDRKKLDEDMGKLRGMNVDEILKEE